MKFSFFIWKINIYGKTMLFTVIHIPNICNYLTWVSVSWWFSPRFFLYYSMLNSILLESFQLQGFFNASDSVQLGNIESTWCFQLKNKVFKNSMVQEGHMHASYLLQRSIWWTVLWPTPSRSGNGHIDHALQCGWQQIRYWSGSTLTFLSQMNTQQRHA